MALKDGSYKGPHWATRRAILEMLKMRGGLSSGEMAAELGISSMAVRQHLHELAELGDVTSSNESKGVGRPTKIWKLLPASEKHFPDRHRDLMLDLLASMKESLGDAGMKALLKERGEAQVASYAKRVGRFSTLARRSSELAEIRSEEGYMAEIIAEEYGGYLLVENHCPICAAAETCKGLCETELDVFQKTLGDGVEVERTEHLLSGSRRCAYRIRRRA